MDHRADLKRARVASTPRRAWSVGLRHEGPEPAIGGASRVRVQLFPLLAEFSQLEVFCNEWLNHFVPPSVAVFKPALPVVLCGILHYPEMGDAMPWRTGAMSQNEVFFLVPLERHREVNGALEFVEYGAATPYILVDNPESAVAGRERFGMPKQDAEFSTESQGGLPWPIGAQQYLKVSAWEPSAEGHRLKPFLQVLRNESDWWNAGARDGDIVPPPDTVFSPDTIVRFGRMLAQRSVALLGAPRARDVVSRIKSFVNALQSNGDMTVFSLRQFADPEWKHAAHYQDLVAFRMRVTDVQRFGMLARNPMNSEFRLLLHRSEIRPITQRLGLKVDQWLPAMDDQVRGGTAEVIDCFAPLYVQTDIELAESERLCWRGRDTGWHGPDGRRLTPAATARYNRYLGPSSAAFLEPTPFAPILDVKYMMLAARRAELARCIRRIIPKHSPFELELPGTGDVAAIRVLTYLSRARTLEEQQDLVWMDGSYLSISAPVIVRGSGEPFFASLMLEDFTDNPFMVQAIRELTTGPTSHAQFDPRVNGWFGSTSDLSRVLGVSTMAIERSASAARIVSSPLLDVFATHRADLASECIEKEALASLRSDVWPVMSAVVPILSVGSIPAPGNSKKEIVNRRVMLTLYEDVEPVATSGSAAPAAAGHVVRFHTTETFPIVEQTGLVSLSPSSEVTRTLQTGMVGPTHSVPVVAFGEATHRVRLSRFKLLWESHDLVSNLMEEPGQS